MNHNDPSTILRMRVTLVAPPSGVAFAIQRGQKEIQAPSAIEEDSLCFEITLRLGAPQADGSPNFLGEFAQGSPSDRFVYINSGVRAGQAESCWAQRAKLKLNTIPRALVEAAVGHPERAIEARLSGSMRDGSPICATIKADAVEWQLLQEAV